MLPMKNMLKRDFILNIASDSGINPAFIEKDWYAVQLLKVLCKFENDRGVDLVFSGGTSLSKGFGLLKRFSEDLDFFLIAPDQMSNKGKRSYRRSMISHIRDDARFTIEDDNIQRGKKYRYFKAQVEFDMEFEHKLLRPYLQLDMTFTDYKLPPLKKDIQSIVSKLTGKSPETKLTCISPVETAANKVSALTWRVVARNRASENDDATLIRHLHDLAALKHKILDDREVFVNCAQHSLQSDQERGGEVIANMSIPERLSKAYEMLSTDDVYREEYVLFVQNMSYAHEDEQISFDKALVALEEIIAILV